MNPQPKQFSVDYASIFQDASVVAAYPNRPPYPAQTFALLAELIDHAVSPLRILDAGCGTGEMTRGLLPYVDAIDAVDISAAMIAAGQQLPYGADPRINWIVGGVEAVDLQPPYALIVAAASLHWMPWAVTLPRFAQLLGPNGYLALVETCAVGNDWPAELTALVAQFSLNQDYQPYSMLTIADELQQHGLFQQVGVGETQVVSFRQPLAAWIEAFHAGNGFSRERMGAARAAAFDQHLYDVMRHHCVDGAVEQQIRARIIYGRPLASPS